MPAKRAKTAKKRPAKRSGTVSTLRFERLLRDVPAIEHYSLCLYVTGTSERSTQAVANIRALCDEYLSGRYDLEVIDIYQQPAKAADEQIIAAPTLVKRLPSPPKRLIGDLSNRDKVIVGLNLKDKRKQGAKTEWSVL